MWTAGLPGPVCCSQNQGPILSPQLGPGVPEILQVVPHSPMESSRRDKFWECVNWNYAKLETGLPWWLSGKESSNQCRSHRFDPSSRNIPHAN